MTPSIDHILLSSRKHGGARMSKRLFQCLRKSKHQTLDASKAPVSGSGPLPPSILPLLHPVSRNPPRQKSISLLPARTPRRLSLNSNRRPPSFFLWIRRGTSRNRKPAPPSLRPGYCFGRKVSNPKARRRRCRCVELLMGIRRTKGRRMVKEQISRSPGS